MTPRNFLANAALIGAGLAVGLTLGETASRVLAPFTLSDGRLVLVRERNPESDPVTVREVDGVPLWFRSLPDRPPPRKTKEGIRVVVLGDSVLMPALLPDRQGAVRILESLLSESLDGGPYEVVNLAQGGWSTRQEEVLLRNEGLALSPDLVVVGVTSNDNQQYALIDGQLVLADLAVAAEARGNGTFAHHSYLWNWIWLALETRSLSPRLTTRSEDPILAPLARMASMTRAAGARFAILCLPDLPAEGLDPAASACAWPGISAWAQGADIPLLSPASTYIRYPMPVLRLDHIHLTAFGHRVLAGAWLHWLVHEQLLPWRAIRTLPELPPVPEQQ